MRETPLLPLHIDGIPAELKAISRWVAWRAKRRDRRWSKIPICCHTGRSANVADPRTWTNFENARNYAREHALAGIGLVFSDDDDVCGVDLDKCRDPDSGHLKQSAWNVIRLLDSYTEVSPSGTGVKIFLRSRPAGDRIRTGNVEIYHAGQFFTVTGHHAPGTNPLVAARPEELALLYRKTFGPHGSALEDPEDAFSPHGLTDQDIFARAMRAKNGEHFARLWTGNTAEYQSESEADLALCRLLAFWVGPDAGRIERLFTQSALAKREKWRERPDYREMTISRAIEDQETFYEPGRAETVLTRGTKNNQTNQSIQDKPRTKDTTQTCPSTSGEIERASELAVELAEGSSQLPDWQSAFQLARRLRVISRDHPEQFERSVIAYCEKAGRPFEEFWYVFLSCWPKVRSAEGEDVFAWAAERAKSEEFTPTPCLGPMYKAVASIAWHLSQFTNGKPIWLPRERLANLLNTNAMTISRVVSLLERNGVLQCVDANYSYTQAKAKEYVFLDPAVVQNSTESAA
jgi:putative DNA primase/helicase